MPNLMPRIVHVWTIKYLDKDEVPCGSSRLVGFKDANEIVDTALEEARGLPNAVKITFSSESHYELDVPNADA